MTDLVNPGGRPMTGYLQNALDGMSPQLRRIAIRVFSEPCESALAPLYRALVVELQLCGLREQETDRQFRQMTQDSIEMPPPPPPTGPRLQMDPGSGEFFEIPDESSGDQS